MIEITNTFIYVKCSDHQAKSMDAIWVKSKNAWRVPNTIGALRELHKFGFDVSEYGKKKSEARKRLLERKEKETYSDEIDLTMLRPYQKMDINFLSSVPHCGVFSEQRTGKSVTTLKLMEVEGRKKNLIVCPASLVLNWANEIRKFTNKTSFPVNGNKTKRMKTYKEFKEAEEGYLIMSKEVARSDADTIRLL